MHPTSPHASQCWLRIALGLSLLGVALLGQHQAIEASSTPKVVLSGIFFDGYLRGKPEPEESIRLSNLHRTRAVDVGGWRISDRYFILSRKKKRSRRKQRRHGSRLKYRDIILPSGTRIPPGGSIWVAYQADAFRKVFGVAPKVEAKDTLSGVLKASIPRGWPYFYASRGIVSLHNAYGATADVLCYERKSLKDTLVKKLVPRGHWSGPAVLLRFANPYSWTGQVLARDRDAKGIPVPDTNTASDWDNSFSRTRLGRDLTHRVELPGQSFFHFGRWRNIQAELLVTSAPENNYSAITNAFAKARKEILINIYKFTNDRIADVLVAALKRGVKVKVLMEGSPVGGVEERSRAIAKRIEGAGGVVLWMRGKRKQKIYRRYRFNHAKYTIIDRTWLTIGSENFGTTGHPVHPSYGNRGWEIHIRSPRVVRAMLRVWDEDTDIKRFRDLVRFRDVVGFKWGAPKPSFRPRRTIKKGHYTYRRKPLRVRGRMDLELVLSPDNSLHEKEALIGAILRCKREVLVAQNSIPLYWGKKRFRSFRTTPTLPLMALIRAARKGCRVRVLIDSVWYHIRKQNPRDNDDSVRILNTIARKHKLDLQAKLINLEAAQVSKIHTKGIIVDGKEAFIGSINWSENSFKGNREVGILVRHPKVAGYYADLFMRDWIRSRLFRVVIARNKAKVRSKPSRRGRILGSFSKGDPLDVLGMVKGYYQVRVGPRGIGYLKKNQQTRLFTPYEARYLVGQVGVVVGRVKKIKLRSKIAIIYFAKPVQGDLTVVAFRKTILALRKKHGILRRALRGRYIQVKGRISTYRGGPQMILRRIEHLSILR